MTEPNRLAKEGERIVVHRFPQGSLGLASPADIQKFVPQRAKKGFWATLLGFFVTQPEPCPVPAVCIPPGARLLVEGIPAGLQKEYGVLSSEQVTFVQLGMDVNTYRDAFRFASGRSIKLQYLREGMNFQVLDLSGAKTLNLHELNEELRQREYAFSRR